MTETEEANQNLINHISYALILVALTFLVAYPLGIGKGREQAGGYAEADRLRQEIRALESLKGRLETEVQALTAQSAGGEGEALTYRLTLSVRPVQRAEDRLAWEPPMPALSLSLDVAQSLYQRVEEGQDVTALLAPLEAGGEDGDPAWQVVVAGKQIVSPQP